MTRPGPAACTQAAPGSWSGSGRGAGQEKAMVTNPSLTKDANRRRDDSLVTDLVTRARNGDRQAWNALVERYAPLIWSICRRHRLGDADAEDVGQSVWLKLVDQLGTLRDGDPDRGHLRHPDRPGRGSRRPPSAPWSAIGFGIRDDGPRAACTFGRRHQRHSNPEDPVGGRSTVTRRVSSRAGAPPSPRALPSFQAGLFPDSVNRAW